MKVLSLIDPFIAIPVFGLFGISLFILGSTTPSLLPAQVFFFGVGLLVYILCFLAKITIFSRFIKALWIGGLLLLVIVLLTPPIRGSNRWFSLGQFQLQPAEVLKPFFILILSHLLSSLQSITAKDIVKVSLWVLPWIFLIFRQPDLGNVIVYFVVFLTLFFVSGLKTIHLVVGGFLSVVVVPLIWVALREYQKLRLITFLNPFHDPSGAGYNAIQAMITIGSGQLYGLGLGRGTQSRLLFLPEYHTDFVFASLGEEMGFVGAVIVMLLYGILLVRILTIAKSVPTTYEKYFAVGVFMIIFIQMSVNIGMNVGVVPITGITLPLLSYGGSSIISTLASLGFVAASAANTTRRPLVIR